MELIKKIIRKFLYRMYLTGYAESQRIFYENYDNKMKKLATFDQSVSLAGNSEILNHMNDPKLITIGKNSLIRGQLMILGHGGKINIGDNCFVGDNSRIWSSVKITIGNRVLISHNVNIHDNVSHSLDSKLRHEDFLYIIENHTLQKEVEINEAEIIINDDVWIGFNSTIMKGVKIGKGAIIGANTIILKDVEEYAVVVGNPQKTIKHTT